MKKVISVILTLAIVVAVLPFAGIVTRADYTFADVTDVSAYAASDTVYEGLRGAELTTEKGTYFHYEPYGFDPVFVLVYSDGNSESLTASECYQKYDLGFSCSSDQSFDNQWGVGEHEFTLTLGGFSCTMAVKIEKNPIKDISISASRSVLERTGGQDFGSYYKYDISAFDLIVTVDLEDGTQNSIQFYQFYDIYGVSLSYTSDQSAETPWMAGEHAFYVTYRDKTITVPVTIVTSPIVSLSIIACATVMEESNGRDNGRYYEYFPDSFQPQVTALMTDGNTVTMPLYQFANTYNLSVSSDSDQEESGGWKPGDHEFTINLGGTVATLAVHIDESPVESISAVAASTVYEGINGAGMNGMQYSPSYFQITITVKLKSQEEPITVNWYDFEFVTGARLEWYSDQSTSPWTAGDHEFTLKSGKATCTLPVTITPSPIKSISAVARKSVEEYTGGFDYGGYYNYYVSSFDPLITVTLSNGDTKTVSYSNFFKEFGIDIVDASGQNYDNSWGVGEHQFTLSAGTATCTLTVNIIPTSIAEISLFSCEKIIQNTCGSYISENFYSYSVSGANPKFKIRYKNGNVKIADMRYFYAVGTSPVFETDQSEETPWGLGKHNVNCTVAEFSFDFTVEIVPSPVVSVSAVAKGPVIKGDSVGDTLILDITVFYENNDSEQFTYAGNSSVSNTKYESYDITFYDIDTNTAGQKTATLSVLGCKTTFEYTVIEKTPFNAVTISGDKVLKISIAYTDGTTLQGDVSWIDIRMGDEDGTFYGYLLVEGKVFNCEISCGYTLDADGNKDFDFGKDVTITLSGVTSNTLSECKWTRNANPILYWCSLCISNPYYGFFDGKVTSKNINALIWSAARIAGIYDTECDGEEVRAAVKKYFDVGDFDLTSSDLYNADVDTYTLPDQDNCYLPESKLTYDENVGWTFSTRNTEGVNVTLVLGEDGRIKQFGAAVPAGDLDGNGSVDYSDVLLISRYLSGHITSDEIDLEAADVTGDGVVDICDVVKIMLYIKGEINAL